jgi:hypothetical protein
MNGHNPKKYPIFLIYFYALVHCYCTVHTTKFKFFLKGNVELRIKFIEKCWNTKRGGESVLVLLILFNHNVYCLLYENITNKIQ